MSTATICYPNAIQKRPASHLGWSSILISFVLIATIILVIVVSANAVLTSRMLVHSGSVTAVPVSTPPTAEIQPTPTGTSVPFSGPTSAPSVVAAPVPTP